MCGFQFPPFLRVLTIFNPWHIPHAVSEDTWHELKFKFETFFADPYQFGGKFLYFGHWFLWVIGGDRLGDF